MGIATRGGCGATCIEVNMPCRGCFGPTADMLDPGAEVQPANRYYTVTPKRGPAVTGRLLNQDTFSVQLMDADEHLRSFQKADLRDFGFAESPMPSYRETFDAQALADVVSFLVSLRGESTP